MKNYHDTRHEAEIIKLRLEILKQNKESLQTIVDPKSVVTDKIIVDGGQKPPDGGIVSYLYLLSKIENEEKEKTKRLVYLEEKLKTMEKYLREIKDVKYRVFVMRYVDGLKVRDIAWKLNYTECYIYKLLYLIKKKLKV